MKFPSHYLEIIKFSNKNLVVDYEIEKVPLKIFGKDLNMNQWLTFKDWLEIYEKLELILYEQNKQTDCDKRLSNFKKKSYLICNNRIKVEIVKESFPMFFAEIFQVDAENFYSFILRIHVTLENEITLSNGCSLLKKTNKYIENISSSVQEPNLIYEPYKPVQNKLEDENETTKFVKYTPSQISQEEPYTPQLLSNKEETVSPDLFSSQKAGKDTEKYPIYKASPISSGENENSVESSNNKDKYTQKKRKKLNDKTCQEPRETRSQKRPGLRGTEDRGKGTLISTNGDDVFEPIVSQVSTCKRKDLFGSDDSEIEEEYEIKTKPKQIKDKKLKCTKLDFQKDKVSLSQRKKALTKVDNGNSYSPSNIMENWLNTDKLKKAKTKQSKITSKYDPQNNVNIERNNASELLLISEEERQLKRARHNREIQAITELNNAIKHVTRVEKRIESKTLNHLSVDVVLSTFSKYRIILNKHFENFKLHSQRNIPKVENLDYMALQNFIPAKHLLAMCTFLRENYESGNGVPQFTDLYMNLLIPEWVLAIFMEEYKMDRQEALQQILDQEEINMPTQLSTQMIDDSFNVPAKKKNV